MVIKAWFYSENGIIRIEPLMNMVLKEKLNLNLDTYKKKEDKITDDLYLLLLFNTETEVIEEVLEKRDINTLLTLSEAEECLLYTPKAEFEKKVLTTIPENLFINKTLWNFLNSTIDKKLYPLLIGPKGIGKTKTAYSIAKAKGMEFYSINCGAIFKPKQTLVGQTQLKGGETFLLESNFLKHFSSDKPTLIFLDELSRIPSGAANTFMTIFDPLHSYIYVEDLGKEIYKGKDVVFIAAANFGFEYTDTRNLDSALLDRFVKFLIDYLPEDEEIKLLLSENKDLKIDDARFLVKIANKCRKNYEKLRTSVSTRQLLAISNYFTEGYSQKEIINYVFLNLFINGNFDMRKEVEQMLNGIN